MPMRFAECPANGYQDAGEPTARRVVLDPAAEGGRTAVDRLGVVADAGRNQPATVTGAGAGRLAIVRRCRRQWSAADYRRHNH